MYMAHTMFRREIGLAPALIRGVAAGDVERAVIVADHLGIVDNSLHHHHTAEDRHLWPRLAERAGDEAEPVVQVMEAQHGAIDKLLDELRAGLAAGVAPPTRRSARRWPTPRPSCTNGWSSTSPPRKSAPCR
jgi:iron-sulfur cluster repair protein YtfE (RIC family)